MSKAKKAPAPEPAVAPRARTPRAPKAAPLTTREAATRVGVHPDHFLRLTREGGVSPESKVGRGYRWRAADVERMLKARARG